MGAEEDTIDTVKLSVPEGKRRATNVCITQRQRRSREWVLKVLLTFGGIGGDIVVRGETAAIFD
jgi:hypothetical protein